MTNIGPTESPLDTCTGGHWFGFAWLTETVESLHTTFCKLKNLRKCGVNKGY